MLYLKKMWKTNKNNDRLIGKIKDVSINNINLEDYLVIDVRSKREFNEGHLKGSINIPLPEIKNKINNYVKNKENKILVYCASGVRSKKAANILKDLGYSNIYNLIGGIENI